MSLLGKYSARLFNIKDGMRVRSWSSALAAGLAVRSSDGFCPSKPLISSLENREYLRRFSGKGKLRNGGSGSDDSVKKGKAAKRKENSLDEDDDVGVYNAVSASENLAVSSFATSYHAPVMWKECIDALLQRGPKASQHPAREDDRPLVFVDGTLGGGGHSQALLEQLRPGDVVFGCDVDADALAVASERLSSYCVTATTTTSSNSKQADSPLFVPVRSNFANLSSKLLSEELRKVQDSVALNGALSDQIQDSNLLVDGILLDLGVSSYQIDTPERGFAFMKDGPLDMRMGGKKSPFTAASICNEFDAAEIKRIFRVYGDEPRARVITNAIIERRPLKTTQDLHDAVAAVIPQFARKGRRAGRVATLARVFQSLRIVVNQEDVVLKKALTEMAPSLIRTGGRLVVLSYHSMEDRATKRSMRDGTVSKREAHFNREQRDMYGNHVGKDMPFKPLGKPIKAQDDEIELNARARSATLRVAERLEQKPESVD